MQRYCTITSLIFDGLIRAPVILSDFDAPYSIYTFNIVCRGIGDFLNPCTSKGT